MHHFYKKALVAFVLLLLADAVVACFCLYQGYPSSSLLALNSGGSTWRVAAHTDASLGGASSVRIRDSGRESLSFDLRLSAAIPHAWAAAALMVDAAAVKSAALDLSKYSSVTFLAKCQPANSLILSITTVDDTATGPHRRRTNLPVVTYFSCNEKGTPVSLDLTRLAIPGWWYEVEKVDIGRRSYKLDRVTAWEFGGSQYSPRDVDSHVELSDLKLHGRDDRYLAALAGILSAGWVAYGIWFFRAQSGALIATLESRLNKDLSFVAYRQLTLEPFEDQEKAAILRFIATNYASPGLELDEIAAATGASRNKINDVLRADLGMTLSGYLRKLRLTEAARLLSQKGSATVAEIARSVGYTNASYFNKLFKEEYGSTPREFKKLASRLERPPDCKRIGGD